MSAHWLPSAGDVDGRAVGVACGTVSAVALLWWLRKGHSVKSEYYERVRRRLDLERHRRQLLTQQLTTGGQLMTVRRQLIVELPLAQLIEQLQSGKITATEALRAYQAKALEVTKLYNCVTEFVLNADERAAALDALPESKRGPLHGVPISVKDSIDLEGFDSTLGLAKYLDRPAASNAPLVQTFIDLGAVPFCKTNVPQTMLSFGCSNPVWGVTTNIRDPARVPGGSSGGEAVLVAAGGSPLGLGSDIGGSARVPALFSGCCGFKPTCGRVSSSGLRSVMPATTGIRTTVGFLAREPSDVRRVLRLITTPLPGADMYRLDPLLPRVLWNETLESAGRPWRVGYLSELPFCPVTPGVRRVITETVSALEAAGMELVPFQLDCGPAEAQLFMETVQPDNGAHLLRAVADEEVDVCIGTLITLLKLPHWLRRLLRWATDRHFRYLPTRLRAWTADPEQAVVLRAAQDQYVQRTVTRWRAARLDLLLLPGFACPPPPRHRVSELIMGGLYTMLMNMLNFPAGILTVDRETEEDQAALEHYPTPSVELQWFKDASRGALGQPLGVQVAALPWMEEQLLAGMCDIERAIEKHYRKT
ncbi:fatty-acid amide hydrolase 1-like [Amphibalanus amphitrite]|uniref:fatty-acid amide hydrolase 1-like n=1 Tax=Amphibalanus amphitrite TaxID=1232801 RepID=UPI001C90FDC0|nr:fatty-acid amide hydrolase 1-like [Amphibalanus amphitrite]XP_043189294.1 fatty-acid amide hydrolase 1-like [Amphibalanus amphitrite]